MAESQCDQRVIPRALVRAAPKSPLVFAAAMLASSLEDLPTRDSLGGLLQLRGTRRTQLERAHLGAADGVAAARSWTACSHEQYLPGDAARTRRRSTS
jgi:hypothetical protein